MTREEVQALANRIKENISEIYSMIAEDESLRLMLTTVEKFDLEELEEKANNEEFLLSAMESRIDSAALEYGLSRLEALKGRLQTQTELTNSQKYVLKIAGDVKALIGEIEELVREGATLSDDDARFLHNAGNYIEVHDLGDVEENERFIANCHVVLGGLKEMRERKRDPFVEEHKEEIDLYNKLGSDLLTIEWVKKNKKVYKFNKAEKTLISDARKFFNKVDVATIKQDPNEFSKLKAFAEDVGLLKTQVKFAYDMSTDEPNLTAKKVVGGIVAAPGVAVNAVASVGAGILKSAAHIVDKVGDVIVGPFLHLMKKGEQDFDEAENLGDKIVAGTEFVVGAIPGLAVALPGLAATGILKLSGFVLRLAGSLVALPFELGGALIAKGSDKAWLKRTGAEMLEEENEM